jgi:hypothetical protein
MSIWRDSGTSSDDEVEQKRTAGTKERAFNLFQDDNSSSSSSDDVGTAARADFQPRGTEGAASSSASSAERAAAPTAAACLEQIANWLDDGTVTSDELERLVRDRTPLPDLHELYELLTGDPRICPAPDPHSQTLELLRPVIYKIVSSETPARERQLAIAREVAAGVKWVKYTAAAYGGSKLLATASAASKIIETIVTIKREADPSRDNGFLKPDPPISKARWEESYKLPELWAISSSFNVEKKRLAAIAAAGVAPPTFDINAALLLHLAMYTYGVETGPSNGSVSRHAVLCAAGTTEWCVRSSEMAGVTDGDLDPETYPHIWIGQRKTDTGGAREALAGSPDPYQRGTRASRRLVFVCLFVYISPIACRPSQPRLRPSSTSRAFHPPPNTRRRVKGSILNQETSKAMILLLKKLGHPVPLQPGNSRDKAYQKTIAQGWAIARTELAPRIPGALEYLDETQKLDGCAAGGAMRGRKVRARRAGRHLPWCCI